MTTIANLNEALRNGRVVSALDAASSDSLGAGVAISGNKKVLAAGARQWEGALSNCGGVYIYDRVGEYWTERGSILTAASVVATAFFGYSVALNEDGTILAVGSPGVNTNAGLVYIFDWSGSAWVQRGTVTAGDTETGDNFGSAVALSSDGLILVVGATAWDGALTDQGGVYIYDWSGSAWVQRGTVLVAGDGAASDFFGRAVAVNSDATMLAVGATQRDTGGGSDRGGVYIYDWISSAWVQRGAVIGASDGANVDNFGSSLALSGDGNLLLVGASAWEGSFTDQGAVYWYEWTGSAFSSFGPGVMQAHDPGTNYKFGSSVSISADGTMVVIGSEGWTRPTSLQGGVYTYDFYRYYLAGTGAGAVVDDVNAPAARQFFAHERATGRLVGGAESDVAGLLEIAVCTSEECYVVGLDDAAGTQYNALLLDKLVPV